MQGGDRRPLLDTINLQAQVLQSNQLELTVFHMFTSAGRRMTKVEPCLVAAPKRFDPIIFSALCPLVQMYHT